MITSDHLRPTAVAPWLGPAAYSEGDAEFFKGRTAEAADLHRLIHTEPMCMLYGDSGLGKTSLLLAGVFPLLRAEGWLPVRIRLDQRDTDDDGNALPSLTAQILSLISESARAASIEMPDWNNKNDTLATTLGEGGAHIRNTNLVLVFDQFEECWTLTHDRPEARNRVSNLLNEFAELFRSARTAESDQGARRGSKESSSLRIVFSMQEHPSADLHGLQRRLPSLASAQFRLLPFSVIQVREIVELAHGHTFNSSVAEAIVNTFARDEDAQRPVVDPTQLSVFCTLLIQRRRKSGIEDPISGLFVDGMRDGLRGGFVRQFYESVFTELPEELAPSVRLFVENGLLNTAGYRVSVAVKEVEKKHGIISSLLQQLVAARLIQYVNRCGGQQHVELIHDRIAVEATHQRTRRTLHAARLQEDAAELRNLVAAIAYRERAESSEQEIEKLKRGMGNLRTETVPVIEKPAVPNTPTALSRKFIIPALSALSSLLLVLLVLAHKTSPTQADVEAANKKADAALMELKRQTAEAENYKNQARDVETQIRTLNVAHQGEMEQQKREAEKLKAEAKAAAEKLEAMSAAYASKNQSVGTDDRKLGTRASSVTSMAGDRSHFRNFQAEINAVGTWMQGSPAAGVQGTRAKVEKLKTIKTEGLPADLTALWTEWLAALGELAEAREGTRKQDPEKPEIKLNKAKLSHLWGNLRDKATTYGLDVAPVYLSGD